MKFTAPLAVLTLAGAAIAAPGNGDNSKQYTCTIEFANGQKTTASGTAPNGACVPLPIPEACTGVTLSKGDTKAATVQLFSDKACKDLVLSQPAGSKGSPNSQKVGSYCVKP
ncbi:hypothetical protein LTR70_008142 [Exophiala xenobiotica]|uniref:Uncharacterized protein n=1 Tax=Lithohypha guttulata TaxID=1690604 RepID=A0ABR0JTZ6_9EURO|nr:hypothetical protein LTR24_010535 [Lithohypha guttulata]KAK5312544.1 hypothetical protein LTR70_008142 [Exophiala xenobiotica]